MRTPVFFSVAAIFVLGSLNAAPAYADRAASYYHQAMALKNQHKIKEAIAKLKNALRERADYAAAHRSIGIIYRRQKNLPKAIFHLEKAAKLEPSSGQVFYSLGLAYNAAGHKKKALDALTKAANLSAKNARLSAGLGALMMRFDPERAIRYLKKAVALESSKAENYHQLGLAYRRAAGRAARQHKKAKVNNYLKEAEKQMLISLGMKEGNAHLHFDLGVLYRRLEKTNKAIHHYERAVALNPKLASAWWDLGHMYKNAKQNDEAVKAYQRYVDLRGGSGDARIAKKRIAEIKGKK